MKEQFDEAMRLHPEAVAFTAAYTVVVLMGIAYLISEGIRGLFKKK